MKQRILFVKRILFISIFFFIINYISADNNIFIDNLEREIDIFESTYIRYYEGETSLLFQWQLYAKNVIKTYQNISKILEENNNAFTYSEIERITQLINKFKIAFLINESINRHELLLNNFEIAIKNYTVNKTYANIQSLSNILEQLIHGNFYIFIYRSVSLFPFNTEQINKLKILIERNERLTDRLNDIMQQTNI